MKRSLILLIVLIVLVVVSLFIGAYDNFNIMDIFDKTSVSHDIFFSTRLPRTISVIICGGALALSGHIMQTIMGNKFVSPSTTGTMEFCRLGMLIALLFGVGSSLFVKMSMALVVSLIGSILFMFLISRIKMKDKIIIPLMGIMIGGIVASLTTFLAFTFDLGQSLSAWMQGSFSMIINGNYEFIYLCLPLMIIAFLFSYKFTIVGMGDSFSKNLGVNNKSVMFIGLLIVCTITSIVVVNVGSIAFIGLVIPNLVSIIKGDNLRKNIIDGVLLGGVFLLACDILAKTIINPYELSVGLIVSIIGAILFIAILIYQYKKGKI
ncbi:MAG: ABC transporter permease [Anaeroplasmataceae bacterium]